MELPSPQYVTAQRKYQPTFIKAERPYVYQLLAHKPNYKTRFFFALSLPSPRLLGERCSTSVIGNPDLQNNWSCDPLIPCTS
jgi:hypothetical protein